jgi:hypothetical protein
MSKKNEVKTPLAYKLIKELLEGEKKEEKKR